MHNYKCHNCYKSFSSERHLLYHLAFNPKHKDNLFDRKEYACPECDEDFFDKNELQEHIKDEHDGDDIIEEILGVATGIAIGSIFDAEDEGEKSNDDDPFGGFSGGDFSGGGASNDW